MKSIISLLIIAAALLSVTASFSFAQNHCASAPNCQICVSRPDCGYCSINTTTSTGGLGPQCAEVGGKGTQFKCNGVFSIEHCQPAYKCSPETFTCIPSENNQGQSLGDCQKQCINNGTVYACNKSAVPHPKCEVAKAGTPGATSLAVCDASCIHPPTATATGSPHSHAPVPSTTSVGLFACNYTTGSCEPSVPGKGSSKEVCDSMCKKQGAAYTCDLETKQCVELPPGVPGPSHEECEARCNPTPAPGPPNNFPKGLYRGLQIDNSYNLGVVYVDVQESSFTMVMMKDNKVESFIEGTPTHIAPSEGNKNTDIMVIDITAPASLAGKKLGSISDISGLPGPETTFITMGYNTALDGSYPSSVTDAMSSTSSHVLALAKCQTPECKFNLPKLPSGQLYTAHFKHLFPQHFLENAHLSLVKSGEDSAARAGSSFSDRCSQYGASCSKCLSNSGCGWCGQGDVVYITGETGTQCAGFNTNASSTTPWVCAKYYFTTQCPVGYKCNHTSSTPTCFKAAPGDSPLPLQKCEEQCLTTHTPAPPSKQYVCNLTLKQCFPCNHTSCAGGQPKASCESECAHHKKGPPSSLKGYWRGFFIDESYTDVEVDYFFTNTTVTAFQSGSQIWEADVISFGNNAMIFTYTSGKTKGFKRSIYYQESEEVPNSLYTAITVAEGKIGGKIPESFPPAMSTIGESALVFYKCGNSPCKFKQP